MSIEGNRRAIAKVHALADKTDLPADQIGNTMRTVQDEFSEFLASDPDAAREVRQHFIRTHLVRRLRTRSDLESRYGV